MSPSRTSQNVSPSRTSHCFNFFLCVLRERGQYPHACLGIVPTFLPSVGYWKGKIGKYLSTYRTCLGLSNER